MHTILLTYGWTLSTDVSGKFLQSAWARLEPQCDVAPAATVTTRSANIHGGGSSSFIANLLVFLPLSSQFPGRDNSVDWHTDRRCLPNHLEGQFGGKMRLEEEQIWLPLITLYPQTGRQEGRNQTLDFDLGIHTPHPFLVRSSPSVSFLSVSSVTVSSL